MKVLYISHDGNAGGSLTALKNIIEQLNQQVESYVVFPNTGMFSDYLEARGIKCNYLKYGLDTWPRFDTLRNKILFLPRVLYKNCLLQYIAYKKLCKLIIEIKPDIIHTNVGPLQIAAHAAKKCNVPHVWHLREYQAKKINLQPFPTFFSFKKLSKILSERNNYKIAITNCVKEYFNITNNYKVIYDGVISKHNPSPSISYENSDYLLFVGRLEDNKGWMDVLKAFIEIASEYPNIKLVFAGSYNTSEISNVKMNIIPSQLLNRIVFLGYRKDCAQLMQKARALVVSSYLEGFGFITTEGMYNGCIVIGRNTSGTKEQFDNGKDMFGAEIGLRFDTQDDLIRQMKFVLSKPKVDFQPMLENAQKIVIEKYSIEKNAEDVLCCYKSLIKQNG